VREKTERPIGRASRVGHRATLGAKVFQMDGGYVMLFATPMRDRLGKPMSARGRLCCKSRFAQVFKNSAGCRRFFSVKT
jgi:hypothetical protein